jgi:hypothetical protein
MERQFVFLSRVSSREQQDAVIVLAHSRATILYSAPHPLGRPWRRGPVHRGLAR